MNTVRAECPYCHKWMVSVDSKIQCQPCGHTLDSCKCIECQKLNSQYDEISFLYRNVIPSNNERTIALAYLINKCTSLNVPGTLTSLIDENGFFYHKELLELWVIEPLLTEKFLVPNADKDYSGLSLKDGRLYIEDFNKALFQLKPQQKEITLSRSTILSINMYFEIDEWLLIMHQHSEIFKSKELGVKDALSELEQIYILYRLNFSWNEWTTMTYQSLVEVDRKYRLKQELNQFSSFLSTFEMIVEKYANDKEAIMLFSNFPKCEPTIAAKEWQHIVGIVQKTHITN